MKMGSVGLLSLIVSVLMLIMLRIFNEFGFISIKLGLILGLSGMFIGGFLIFMDYRLGISYEEEVER